MSDPTAPEAGPETSPALSVLLADSYRRIVGRPLADPAAAVPSIATWLYDHAPFCLLAHDAGSEPCFIYANKAAQRCFGYARDRFIGLPSRLTAEAPDRMERQRLLDAVARNGFVADYRGVRVAGNGKRFLVEDVVVWELIDRDGIRHGQAAMIPSWRDA